MVTKSLTYIAVSVSRKLKPEFRSLPGKQIAEVRKQRGADSISDQSRTVELIYSGDTPIETDGRYDDAKILIHEATFLTRTEIDPNNPKRNKHSSLDTVMEMAAESQIQPLILGHFSSRYQVDQIDAAISREATRCGLKIPIFRVAPGLIASFE